MIQFELILDAINFADINPDDPIHESFIVETLTSFDQIMKATTIEIWSHYKDRVKQITAAQNLKARMRSKETSDITAATSLAIAKATEDINSTNTQHLTSILRINNLEKSTRAQQQKTNEIINALKAKRAQKTTMEVTRKGR
jgi:tellurite resistance protein